MLLNALRALNEVSSLYLHNSYKGSAKQHSFLGQKNWLGQDFLSIYTLVIIPFAYINNDIWTS